jgi:hypothetical protein
MQPRRLLRRRRLAALAAAMALTVALPATSLGASRHPNPTQSYVNLVPAVQAAGGRVVPLINSGQTFDGVTFEGIPDGLGVVPVGQGQRYVDLYVAFEQSHVPFQEFADFEDSSVQRARLDLKTLQLHKLDEVLPASAGYIRFCSAFMAGPREGFDNYTFFLNEESNDILDIPAGAPYGSDPSVAPYRQAGYAVYLDTKTGEFSQIAGMGRHNHENTIIVPGGWDETVSLSGDDTFSPPTSQVYMYNAASPDALLADEGTLYAFRVTGTDAGPLTPAEQVNPFNDANDYLEIDPGDSWTGEFIPVPDDVARGTTAEQPQAALENWSNANNVFQFVRVEDMAYDPDDPRVIYFADTGSTRLKESGTTGRLFRDGANNVPYINSDGRLFKMVLNADDPTVVDELSIVGEGRIARQLTNPPPGTPPTFEELNDGGNGMRAPDNLDVGRHSVMVQEDASNAKIWRYDIADDEWTHVATATHPIDPSAPETSGIIDMSAWMGPGWWALDVQGHVNLPGVSDEKTYVVPITGVEMTYRERREDGQLLLMHVPGS